MSRALPGAATGSDREIDRRILEVFRSNEGVVSGARLSRLLAISRTAVWKHINTLKSLGYAIEAVPSQGYRLVSVPDLLTSAELSAGLPLQRIGTRITCLQEVDSTNLVAYRLAEQGAVEGTVVIADHQTGGKGRLGRRWESPAGVNLYCSVILRPQILPLYAPQLTFVSSVAVVDAILRTTNLQPVIKWPNDVLVNGQKVAGLLNEMSAETERVDFLVLGIGVNINMNREQFPVDLRHPATSLAIEAGQKIDRRQFARVLLESLDALYAAYLAEGYEPLRRRWLAHSAVMGRTVRVTSGENVVVGVVEGIDEHGGLVLSCAGGRHERVLAGDVAICNEGEACS